MNYSSHNFTPPRDGLWASYVPGRSPAFKIYNTRGPASGSVMQSTGSRDPVTGAYVRKVCGGIVYELRDGDWIPWADVPKGAQRGTINKYRVNQTGNGQPRPQSSRDQWESALKLIEEIAVFDGGGAGEKAYDWMVKNEYFTPRDPEAEVEV